jgi:coenzyme PQQ precursor peptide PqqA
MSLSTDCPTDIEKRWKTPTFQEIPISFEASSYALSDDDDPLIR